jgi:predicted transglutaminase-like cysteine proteinase
MHKNENRAHYKGILSSLKSYVQRNRLGELLVLKGLITPQQLRMVLEHQKESAMPLGQVCIQHNYISRRQLVGVLSRQYMLRSLAAIVFFTAGLTSVAGKKARASDYIKDIPAQISLTTHANSAFTHMGAFPGLFDSEEKRSTNLKPFVKWTGMFSRFERELTNPASQKTVETLKKDLAPLQGLNLKAMASGVNDIINRVQYVTDSANWGQSDYWATPIEFMKRGGDCEDYAITKYTALRMLGVPEERLRVAIVHDNLKNIPHAVLVVYTEQGPVVLDNQIKSLVDASEMGRYRPIFSINRTAWWLHTSPGSTLVASAQ